MLVSITVSIRSQSVSGSGSVGGARPALLSSRSISPHGASRLREAFDRGAVPHVDLERQEGVAKLLLKLASAGRRAGRCRSRLQPPATNLRAAASPKPAVAPVIRIVFMIFLRLRARAAPATRSSGFTPSCSGNARQIGLVRLEKAQQGREQRRSPARRRSSSVPIPVRSRNRCARRSSPSVAASAARARAIRVVWRLRAARPRYSRRAVEGSELAKILIVEDNALNIKLFCDLLAAHGHEPEAVTDSRNALDAARELRARSGDHRHPAAARQRARPDPDDPRGRPACRTCRSWR